MFLTNKQLKEKLIKSLSAIIKLYMKPGELWDSSLKTDRSNIYLSSSEKHIIEINGLKDNDRPNDQVLIYVFKYEGLMDLMKQVAENLGYQINVNGPNLIYIYMKVFQVNRFIKELDSICDTDIDFYSDRNKFGI